MSTPSPQPSNKEAILHVDHLSLQYGETEVFSDLCFDIDRGSFVSIVGPNGAGKTQLMRSLLKLVEPTAGYIERNFKMNDIGYVPQKINIDPTLPITVREFMQTYIKPRGFWLQQTLPKLDQNISIDHLLDKTMGKLSGGQLQRVMLAAVLSAKPSILFLDEFSAGIDPRGQAELYGFLHRLHEKDGMTIIMISHDIDITSQYADTVLCLNKRMVCMGRPHDVFTANTFEKMYGIPLTKLGHHPHEDHGDHDTHHHA